MKVTAAIRSVLAVALIATVAACTTKGEDEDSVFRASVDSSALVKQDSAPGADWSEANMFAMVELLNVADSAGGAVAVSRSRNADVVEFGRTMMRDHHMMREQVKALIDTAGPTPEVPSGDTMVAHHDSAMAHMRTMPRDQFDRAYLEHEVMAHEHALAVGSMIEQKSTNAKLRALVTQSKPTMQGHLDRARALLAKYSAGSGSNADTTGRR